MVNTAHKTEIKDTNTIERSIITSLIGESISKMRWLAPSKASIRESRQIIAGCIMAKMYKVNLWLVQSVYIRLHLSALRDLSPQTGRRPGLD